MDEGLPYMVPNLKVNYELNLIKIKLKYVKITGDMKTVFCSFLLLICMPVLLWAHAFYISISEIVYEADHSVTITIKMFTNDLQDAIHHQHNKTIALTANGKIPEKYLEQYISSKFNIAINGEAQTLHLIQQTTEVESTWCKLKITAVKNIQSLKVRNELLTELFSSQTNIVRIDNAGEKRFLKLGKAYFQDEVKF